MLEHMTNSPSFHLDGYWFTPLNHVVIADVVADIDSAPLRERINHYEVSTLEEQLACYALDTVAGHVLMMAVHNENNRYIGMCGVVNRDGDLSAATYLHEDFYGTGANDRCKQVQYECSLVLKRTLYISVQDNNARSLGAMRRAWPAVVPQLRVETPIRTAYLWELNTPPIYGRMPIQYRAAFRQFVVNTATANTYCVTDGNEE
jgi:hypothetical protein